MKLILSRKGFDSAAGGCASPILDDGSLLSLPIPDRRSPIRYRDISIDGHDAGAIVSDLTKGRVRPEFGAHLDPDLVRSAYPRDVDWKPLFGQAGSEQTVLARSGVGAGDVFLYFGWFRQAQQRDGRWRFVAGAPDLHVIWGWLQVAEVRHVNHADSEPWMEYHPHAAAREHRLNNTLYVARDNIVIGRTELPARGAGVFPRLEQRLQLTTAGRGRSNWTLPGWFDPTPSRPPLGYHANPGRWRRVGDRVELASVGRGQEFVLDMTSYPEALPWLCGLLQPSPE